MATAMPWIIKRNPTFKNYAQTPLAKLLPEESLRKARRLEAQELQSGVFLSQAGGGFAFHPLPRLAQIAPIHGIVTGDFDADGNDDIYVVQNTHAPIPELGRFDGGLGVLLTGDGRGGFHEVPISQTGLVVPGDARALALLDVDRDGWPEILASRHNAPALLFGNVGCDGRTALRVILQGKVGNSMAIGAQVTLERSDGTRQTRELHAGGGYLSQDTAACFFTLPPSITPRRIIVRWPWGAMSDVATVPHGTTLTLSAER